MKKSDIDKLDKMFQVLVLSLHNRQSVIDLKPAEVAHHHIPKSKGFATRWWIPNGVSLTADQHNLVHGSSPEGEYLKELYTQKMIEKHDSWWHKDLEWRSNRVVKNLTYKKVHSYFMGERNDYL